MMSDVEERTNEVTDRADRARPNWINERVAACNIGVVFNQLVEVMVRDLEYVKAAVNKSITHQIPETQDALIIDWTVTFSSVRLLVNVDTVHKRIHVLHIIPGSPATDICNVTLRWDAERHHCYVVIHPINTEAPAPIEFRYKHLWKVSRHILDPISPPIPPQD